MNVHIQPASATEAETPVQKVERLTAELSTALDGYCRGQFRAVVEPESKSRCPVQLVTMRRPVRATPEEACAVGADPIVGIIAAYRNGLADFDANAPKDDDEGSDAYAATSYLPPMVALGEWNQPAQTLEGAIAAIRLAKIEAVDEGMGDALVKNMIVAALGFFDGFNDKPLHDAVLRDLMTAWSKAYNVTNEGDINTEPDFTQMEKIEAEVRATVPETAVGFAIKLLILTTYGAMAMDGTADRLLDDAKVLLAQAGIAPPATMGRERELEYQDDVPPLAHVHARAAREAA